MRKYPQYKKVLFCTDFSETSDNAFDYAYGVAKRDKGELYILHVLPRNPHQDFAELYIDSETSERINKAIEEDIDYNNRERYLKKIENGLKHHVVIRSGREDEEILKFARKEGADILVIGTNGKTGIEHALVGSVAERVIKRSPIPVFVIPANGRA